MENIKQAAEKVTKRDTRIPALKVKTFVNDSEASEDDIDNKINSFLSKSNYKLVDVKVTNIPLLYHSRGDYYVENKTLYTVIYDSMGY